MKKIMYIVLAFIATCLLGYTGYYAVTHKETPPVIVATSTPVVITPTPVLDKNTHTTKDGKKITLIETNPTGESISTLTITTSGFATSAPIVIETNKLIDSFYADINRDSFEELIIITMAQGSGSYGEALIYTTASTSMLLPVSIPDISENDTKKGGLFEGYMGHDSFNLVDGNLIREFPTYKKTDTNDSPTGPNKAILYILTEKNGGYLVTLSKATTTVMNTIPVATTTTLTAPQSTSTLPVKNP